MSLKVTITHIARELNTTAATVSRALNDDPSIGAQKKQLIKDTASRMNYRQNKIAASLRRGQTGIIGVIIPSAEINFFGSVVHGIESLANEQGFNVLIFQSNEDPVAEARGIETFLSARVDGILVSVAKHTNQYDHFLSAKAAKVPIVFFDRSVPGLDIPSVVIDDFSAAFTATEHLIQQGFQRIAHIAGPQHLLIFSNRLKGYKAALKQYKIPFRKAYVITGDVSIASGKEAMQQLIQLPEPPDALFAVEDFTALGAIKTLKANKISIPKQFGVIGFADESFGEHITPTLSTINQQTVQMGRASFELLHQLMQQSAPEKVPDYVMQGVPVFRASSSRKKVND